MTHSNTNPRSGQYLTHAHSHITREVAAMGSCFGLVRPHQHGIVVGTKSPMQSAIYYRGGCKAPLQRDRDGSAELRRIGVGVLWQMLVH